MNEFSYLCFWFHLDNIVLPTLVCDEEVAPWCLPCSIFLEVPFLCVGSWFMALLSPIKNEETISYFQLGVHASTYIIWYFCFYPRLDLSLGGLWLSKISSRIIELFLKLTCVFDRSIFLLWSTTSNASLWYASSISLSKPLKTFFVPLASSSWFLNLMIIFLVSSRSLVFLLNFLFQSSWTNAFNLQSLDLLFFSN